MTLTERFWPKVERRGPDECWPWRASRTREGYGRIGEGKQILYAHRLAYELLIGPIPDGLVIDHLCENPCCVNPAHMEPVTRGTNVLRGQSIAKANATKTHCKRGHPFDSANTAFRDGGKRRCRTCHRLDERERAAR